MGYLLRMSRTSSMDCQGNETAVCSTNERQRSSKLQRVGSIAALGVSNRGVCTLCGKGVPISEHRDQNEDGTYRHQECGKKLTAVEVSKILHANI